MTPSNVWSALSSLERLLEENGMSKIEFVNLTPHQVTILGGPEPRMIPATTPAARLQETLEPQGQLDGIPIYSVKRGEVQDLPEPKPGTVFIVSDLVRTALPTRKDLASPGRLERDGKGNIVGARGLLMNGD